MRIAVISLTENGRALSQRIAEVTPHHSVDRYCFYRNTDSSANAFSDLSALVSELFTEYNALVFVCACGIAVRAAAPHLRSKLTDPAVIVTDDCGRFVIPVLSGHIGGANILAVRLAEAIGAQAAVTTATDIGGRFSPDSFAAANGLIITDIVRAKEVAAAVLSGEHIGLVSEYECISLPPEIEPGDECRTGLYIGCGDRQPFPLTLRLIPKNIVLGIGCRRGTDSGTISRTVLEALQNAGISPERVCGAATADIKSDESGLLGFCKARGIPLAFYSAQELMSAEGDFTASEFVKSVVGSDNVCERSAVLCSGGALLLRKTAAYGVTVAAAEKPLIIDFEREML